MHNPTSFKNVTFKNNYYEKASAAYENPLERIQTLQDMLKDVVLDFKFNKDIIHSNELLIHLESQINDFFDSTKAHQFNEAEIDQLTELCRQINEDTNFLIIRDEAANPKKNDEQTPNQEAVFEQQQPILANNKKEKLKVNAVAENKPNEDENKDESPVQEEEKDQPVQEEEEHPVKIEKEEAELSQPLQEEIVQAKAEKRESIEKPIINIVSQEQPKEDKNEQIRKEFQRLLDQMLYNFNEHKLEDAYTDKAALIEYIEKVKQEGLDQEVQEHINKILEEQKNLLYEIDMWYQEIQTVLKELAEDDGFMEDKSKKKYRLKYKLTPDWKAVLKMDGPLDMPLFNVLSLMYEPDGFNHWVPFCKGAKLVKHLHRAAHSYWLNYGLVIIPDRDCYCYGIGVDRLDKNGSVLLISKKIHDNPAFLEHYGIDIPKTKSVRMDIDVAVELVPLSKDRVQMTLITTVNPGVKNVPTSILGWISRKAGSIMFEKLVKKAKNIKGTLWEKRINENREFYGWLEGKVDRFLEDHNL